MEDRLPRRRRAACEPGATLIDKTIGEGVIIREPVEIYGRKITIGREAFLDRYCVIGGGSADQGAFTAGDWLHVGMFSQVNTAADVTIGDEVGIGIGTRIFTHGAYLSEYEGFPVDFAPVTIGSRVWLPNALVLPGVTIGDDVVVAAGSVVTKNLPSGCLAAGRPARPIREHVYPKELSGRQRRRILERVCERAGAGEPWSTTKIFAGDTEFDVENRTISGHATTAAVHVKDQLRRHGIRFRYSADDDGIYRPW
jgi:acetyltransferase-like isoleucine patch superfamily enzyme